MSTERIRVSNGRGGTRLARSARRLAVSLVAAILLCFGAPGMIRQAMAACTSSNMTFVAHEDDDLLFISPDVLHAVQSAPFGACTRTVFVTAGDAGAGLANGTVRENGSRAAYAQMAGVANMWTQSDAGIAGHPIAVFTLNGSPNVSLAFMRLPDGNVDGSGFPAQGNESLQKLWNGVIGSMMHPINGAPPYTRASLISTLTALMVSFQPALIRTMDYVGTFGDGDHSDHHASAFFTRSAHLLYPTAHTLTGYKGYQSVNQPANVAGADLTGKQNAFFIYSTFDSAGCTSVAACAGTAYAPWLVRQYTVGSETVGGGGAETNVAGQATATASSQNAGTGQTANKAIDGVVDGYPGDFTKEWATVGGRGGSFLRLTWATPVTLTRVVLHDRINLNDQVTSGRLTFSDGSTLNVGTLTNNGTGVSLSFAPKTTTSLLFTILSVSATTVNIGLAEIETFSSSGGQPGNQAPVADAGPDATVAAGASVQLDGLDSFDPDGNAISFAWSQIGGPVVALFNVDTATPTFTAPAAPTTLTFQLIVNDGLVSSAPSTVIITVTATAELNRALIATATASSQNSGTGQTANKAIDGVVDGYPGDFTKEWATVGGRAGSFLQLTWATPVILTRVVLHDRPNVNDQILSGTLTFSGGATLPVSTLPNDGSPLTISFPARSTTSLRLTITSVSGTTVNIGLSELEAFGPP
jgi:LmbE family N-acetylglucosaminyl deacetylase